MPDIQSILVPLDGTRESEQALLWARDLAGLHGADLTLVRACPPPGDFTGQEPQSLRDYYLEQTRQAESYLKEVKERCLGPNGSVGLVVAPGQPADVIIASAARGNASLVIMSSHGREGLSRWLLGSVAERVARHCPCPVFLVRS